MFLSVLFRSRTFSLAALAAPLAAASVLCAGAHAQSAATIFPSPATAQPQSAPAIFPSPATAQAQDPTRPEIQPNLDVDRDPIPSPDPETPPVVANTASGANATANPNAPKSSNELAKDQNGMYILHANVDEVLLDCTVLDQKGETVTDLSQRDFRVWEDGAPQTVNGFLHQDMPVSMGILIDNSGSMRDKRTAVNAAAMELLHDSNVRDSAFVVNFSDRAYLDQGFTTDRVALNRGLSRFDSRGTTALYDAVAASADELSRHAKERKQVLLIVTDGADNASRLSLQQAIRRVQDLGGPVVYTIGLLFDSDKDEADRARSALERLSQETGGFAYFPRSLDEVNGIAAEIARDIRNQYTVAYHSSRPSSYGGYRVVHVEASAPGHGKLTVITRHGYYANPNPAQTAQESHP
jgi:Ca-activated chloride channel homolog